MRQTKPQFVYYLESTLIPDLKEGGRDATAEDFEDLVRLIKHPTKAPGAWKSTVDFVKYLEETLVPDLYQSDHTFTAKDFQTGIAFWRDGRGGRKAKRPTLAAVKAELRPLDIVVKKTDGEYCVNFRKGREETAYYTDDIDDALASGHRMHREEMSR